MAGPRGLAHDSGAAAVCDGIAHKSSGGYLESIQGAGDSRSIGITHVRHAHGQQRPTHVLRAPRLRAGSHLAPLFG